MLPKWVLDERKQHKGKVSNLLSSCLDLLLECLFCYQSDLFFATLMIESWVSIINEL